MFFFVGTTANIYFAEKKLGVANYTIEGYKYFTLLYSQSREWQANKKSEIVQWKQLY